MPPIVGAFLFTYVAVGFIQFFNPLSFGPLVGLLGLRTHFAYLPLMLLAPLYIRTPRELTVRLAALCLIIVPIVALGVLQTRLPGSHPLNAGIDAAFGTRNLARATGTFSYITGYGILCQFVTAAAATLLVLRPLRSRDGLIAVVGVSFAFIGCLSSGSRAPVFGAALQLALFAMILLWSQGAGQAVQTVLRTALAGVLAVFIAITQIPDVSTAFQERVALASFDVNDRVASGTFGWVDVLAKYPLGNGIGMGHQKAGTLVGRVAGFLSGYEDELSRIGYELGVLGFAAFVAFRISLLVHIGLRARALGDLTRASVAALSFSTMALMLTGGVFTPMANALVFVMAGLGLAVVPRATPSRLVATKHFTPEGLGARRQI
jgi:hypothetical protein